MASYNSILRHVSMADVKRNTWKLQEQKRVKELCRQEEINLIKNNNSPEYSDWRCASLNENMTTKDIMFTTFPATDEISLETINAANAGSFTSAGGQLALNGTSIKASGSGSGEDGGFNLGQSYLAFDGDASSRHAILDPIDSSTFDTLNISAIVGNDYNGGEDPDEAGAELRLYYLEPGGSSFKSISVTPSGDQVLSANSDVIIGLGDGNGSLQEFSISLPAHARGAGFTYMLYQLVNSGPGFDHYGITSINYKRRSPVSLFVALDSPEATSFIGDGSGNLSPAEKKKRLQDMLSASSEYMDKKFPYNKAAIRDAETNLRSNDIDIDVSIDTFKFPTYGSPEFNRMFKPTISADSSKDDVKNYLETKGLTLDVDTLNKDFKVGNGWFESLGVEGTESLLNNPETQELALTAMGVDFNIITNLTDDTYKELQKATYFKPGGTPSTGWDGKFYQSDDPLLEASRIVPLETYLEAKKRDGWYGAETPDRAEPGYRYVLEKKYSWREDGEVKYTSVQNDTLSKQASELVRLSISTGGDYNLGINYHYGYYVRNGRPAYLLKDLASIVGNRLNYVYRNLSLSAYGWVERNSKQGVDSKLDPRTEFDPLWIFDVYGARGALEAIKGISSGRDLDSNVSFYTSSTDSRQRKLEKERYHKEENDYYFNYVKEALERFEGINDALVFEKDDWYQGKKEIIEFTDVHPYSGLRPETPEKPQESQPEESLEPENNYPPELNEVGGKAYLYGNTITKQGFKKSDGDFDIFVAGGGNAKMSLGFTYEQVMEIGRKNLNVLSVKSLDNKTDTKFQYKNGNLNPIGYSVANERIDNALNYSSSLAMTLGLSILTGQSREIKLGDRGRQDMIQSVNPSVFESALKIGRAIRPTVDNAVNPTPGKKLNVFTGLWGVPGGAEVDYNPTTDTLTFTSNKMLRKGKGDEYNEIGTVITKFGDIPTPTKSELATKSATILQSLAASIGIKPKDGWDSKRYYPGFKESWRDELADRFTNNQLANALLGTASQLAGFSIQGSASNIVALRNLMTNAGLVRPSAMEKTYGGYGHVYTQTSYTGSQIPQELRQIINRRMGKGDLGGGSLGDTLKDTGATDAAAAAAETQRKKKKTNTLTTEMYDPKTKHNEKITKNSKMKSPKEFFKQADVKPIYPDNPPPKLIKGRHPDFYDDTKIAKRFTKLDPISAKSMPDTGSPQVDALVRAARKRPK